MKYAGASPLWVSYASRAFLVFKIASILEQQAPFIASIVSSFWRVERRSIFGL